MFPELPPGQTTPYRAALATLILILSALPAFSQGSLTPPAGPPVPVMRTLHQVEPRIPIEPGSPGVTVDGDGGVTISQSGSYYLTGDLVYTGPDKGVFITGQDVSLDLNGFTISGIAQDCTGAVYIDSGTQGSTIIRNGMIRGASFWSTENGGVFTAGGWSWGIIAFSGNLLVQDVNITGARTHGITSGVYCRGVLERVTVADSGSGILMYNYSVIRNCTVFRCGDAGSSIGIRSQNVSDCTVWVIHGSGILDGATVENCLVNAEVIGISSSASVANSSATAKQGVGISSWNVSDCRGVSESGSGIYATGYVSNSYGSSQTGTGLYANSATNSGGNTTSGSYGLQVQRTASYCHGHSTSGGVAISAYNAIACTTSGGTILATNKLLGTP